MEIQNLYSIDIFFQGVFLMLCVSTGLYIVFKDNLETFKEVYSLRKFSLGLHELVLNLIDVVSFNFNSNTSKSRFGFIGFIPVIIISAFIAGILGYGIADNWMDSRSRNHLGLKALWGGVPIEYYYSLDTTDDSVGTGVNKYLSYKTMLRYKNFEKVFNKEVQRLNKREVEQLYFQAKHTIIKDPEYYNYVRKSQSLVEYSRVFALGFFFLFICSFVNLILMITRVVFNGEERSGTDEITEKGNQIPRTGLKAIINVSNGVILIFNVLAVLAIASLANPRFQYAQNDLNAVLLFVLVYFGCFTFFLNLFRSYRSLRFSFFLYSIFYVLSLLGYFASSKLWITNEGKVSSKVFGIYKTLNTSSDVEEMKYAKDVLKLNVFNTDGEESSN